MAMSRADREAFWGEHIEAWQASGQSQRAYCRAAGISYHSFQTALRRRRAAEERPLHEAGGAGGHGAHEQAANQGAGESPFVPVDIVAPEAGRSVGAGREEIEIASAAVTVRLPPDMDGPRLAQAIAAVRGRP